MSMYVILGGTGGIGSQVVRQLLHQGDKVIILSRHNIQDLTSLPGCFHYEVDATDFSAVEHRFKNITFEHGIPDGIANCVGSILLKPAHLTSETEWRKTLSLNLDTAFATVKAAGIHMNNGGSVVLMSTCAARIGLSSHEAISAAKAGVEGLMRAAATTYAPKIRFNCVAPGLVRTSLGNTLTKTPSSEQASIALHPLKRLGESEEVARLIVWLLNPQNSWVTGQVYGIDGGLSTLKNVR